MSDRDLRVLMKHCYDLPDQSGEHFWSRKIAGVINSSDETLPSNQLKEFVTWFGGLGSFNDLMTSSVNDHSVDPADEPRINDELERLREAIDEPATASV